MKMKNVDKLRALMRERNIDMYLVPTSDFHNSEYVGEHFKCRQELTGFSGSQGTALVTPDHAILWTDGRYFIQAEKEIRDTGFELYKMGVKGVPTLMEFVKSHLPEGGTRGFDGGDVDTDTGRKLLEIVTEKSGAFYLSEDLVGLFFENRPALSHEKAWILETKYAGISVTEKLGKIREEMEKKNVKAHFMAELSDIAWTLNLRGNDAAHFPIILSYLYIEKDRAVFFVQKEALTAEVEAYLSSNRITVMDYDAVYDIEKVIRIEKGEKILLDFQSVNFRLTEIMAKNFGLLDDSNPAFLMKAVKNETEIKNIKTAQLRDGIAMTKLIYWLKNEADIENETEWTVSEKLHELRAEQEHFLDDSFETISAYKDNAAMMHYSATKDSAAGLSREHFLLIDSGGHYLEGSTDITRTIALGPLSEEEKRMYTIVLRAHLNLQSAKFLSGCTGQSLDILARGPLWDLGLDYRCGTGHGIGYLLNIHEGPNGFRYRKVPERNDGALLLPGMITTDEPGVYVENEYGIRTENELLTVVNEENEYGTFLSFEPVTYCPYDLSAVDKTLMTPKEVEALNNYHEMIYNVLSPYLTEKEKEFLKEETRRI